MSKRDGEFIHLHWEHEPSVYYVRGHVTPEQFATAVNLYRGNEVDEDLVIASVRHAYARWIPTPGGDVDYVIREEAEKRRGCFAVSVVEP